MGDDLSAVGLYFQQDGSEGKMYVARIVKGSSADRSGVIQVGDIIAKVGKTDVENESLATLRNLILGPQGTKVLLSFRRKLDRETVFYDVELVRGSPEYFESMDRVREMQTECDSLRAKLRQANTFIRELHDEIDRLRRSNTDETRLKTLQNQLQARGDELREMEERLARTQQLAREEERARLDLEGQLNPLEAENRVLREKEREYTKSIEELRKIHQSEIEPLERVIRQQEISINNLRSLSRELEGKLREAERESDALKLEIQRRVTREEDLKRRFHHEVVKAEEALRSHEEHLKATETIFPALQDLHGALLSAAQGGGIMLNLSPLRLPPTMPPAFMTGGNNNNINNVGNINPPAVAAAAASIPLKNNVNNNNNVGGEMDVVEAERQRMHQAFLGNNSLVMQQQQQQHYQQQP